MCWIGLYQSITSYQSNTWPAVDATIVNYRFDVTDGGTPILLIQYQYTIEGIKRASGWTHVTPEKCEDSDGYKNPPELYAKGKTIVAYVNPSDPAFSLLKKGLGWKTTLPIIIGAGLIAMAILGISAKSNKADELSEQNLHSH